jgi:hypothetical protein
VTEWQVGIVGGGIGLDVRMQQLRDAEAIPRAGPWPVFARLGIVFGRGIYRYVPK